MFVKKLLHGALGGFALGVLGLIGGLTGGKSLGDSLEAIPGGILLGIILVFWWTRNLGEDGNVVQQSSDQQIDTLQRDLRRALQWAATYESRGDQVSAAASRADAIVIESQLRRLGA